MEKPIICKAEQSLLTTMRHVINGRSHDHQFGISEWRSLVGIEKMLPALEVRIKQIREEQEKLEKAVIVESDAFTIPDLEQLIEEIEQSG